MILLGGRPNAARISRSSRHDGCMTAPVVVWLSYGPGERPVPSRVQEAKSPAASRSAASGTSRWPWTLSSRRCNSGFEIPGLRLRLGRNPTGSRACSGRPPRAPFGQPRVRLRSAGRAGASSGSWSAPPTLATPPGAPCDAAPTAMTHGPVTWPAAHREVACPNPLRTAPSPFCVSRRSDSSPVSPEKSLTSGRSSTPTAHPSLPHRASNGRETQRAAAPPSIGRRPRMPRAAPRPVGSVPARHPWWPA